MGVIAEGKGEAVGAVVGEGLVDGFSGVSKVSLSPNVPLSPSSETKQEAGGCVPVIVAYLYVENDVGLCDTATDGGFVVAKTVKTISSVFFSISMKLVKRTSKIFS